MFKDGTWECILCEFEGVILGSLYLYHWYTHTTYFSNDCVGGSRLWGLLNAF